MMKLPRRNFLHLAAGAAALPAVSRIASAQAYPTRPVRVIVPFAPAGDTDLVARLMGQWLSERLGTAKQATSVIPIVFAAVGDPVGSGVVKSLVRPGGNATGLSLQATDAVGKRLQLLGEVITGLRRLAIMANSGNPSAALEMREAEDTAPHAGSRRSYIRNPSIRRHRACVRH